MEPFTKVNEHYRDFTVLVNVESTVFGFQKGDLVTFREVDPGQSFFTGQLLAVVRPRGNQIEIGQFFSWVPTSIEGRVRKIRLWNDQVGDFLLDFDGLGTMIRPTQTAWRARLDATGAKNPRCCPQDGSDWVCRSYAVPCGPGCPYLVFTGEKGDVEKAWEWEQRAFVCGEFCRPDSYHPGSGCMAGGCDCRFTIAGEKRR
jgi:hypothetical protein